MLKIWAKFAYAAKSAKAPAQNRTGDLKVWSKTLLPTDLQRSVQILACKHYLYPGNSYPLVPACAGDVEWQTAAWGCRMADQSPGHPDRGLEREEQMRAHEAR